VLQGVGGGLMTPVGLSMLFHVFPLEERVRAAAILIIPTALPSAVGPIIGGLFVADLSWRWVFYVNVPIGVCAVVFGAIFLADQRLFLQNALGLDALHAGLTIFPEAVAVVIGSQFIGRLIYPIVGPRHILVTGLVVIAGVAAVVSRVDTGISLWLIRHILFFLGIGVAASFLPSQAAAFATIGPAKTGMASAIFNAQRQLGGAVGVAALTAVITALHPVHVVAGHSVTNPHALRVGLLVSGGIAGCRGRTARRRCVVDSTVTETHSRHVE
jgi:predicted MFS family arabinose efflux permease